MSVYTMDFAVVYKESKAAIPQLAIHIYQKEHANAIVDVRLLHFFVENTSPMIMIT
jgi:hypothetical protein